MNNDPTPTSAAALVPENENENTTAALDPATASSTGPPENAPTAAQSRATLQMKKKYEFIDHIMNNLDMLIYVELCILYYMDCSFFRLIIRVLAQVMFLTPKPSFVPPMPKHRPYIGAIFGPNIICIILHIFTSRSEAGEAMRGYLHGGMIIDLIGQKGPTSKMHLVLLDLLVTALQCFMLSVHVERERLRDVLLPKPAGAQVQPTMITAQDHDAEERGVMRDSVASNGDTSANAGEASGANGSQSSDMDQERERLLAEPSHRAEEEEDEYPLDIFYSGTAMVGEFHVLHTLRTQWDDYGNATASALQTVGFSAEFAAASADRRIVAVRRGLESSFN